MFLILFCNIIKVETGSVFSINRKLFQYKTTFCQFSNMASSGLRKMLTRVERRKHQSSPDFGQGVMFNGDGQRRIHKEKQKNY